MSIQVNVSLADLASEAQSLFKHSFGIDSTLVAAAPGRVNLIGEHIDYCNGFVLPLAIERYIAVAAAPNERNEIRLRSAGQPDATIDLGKSITISEPKWSNYVRGVVAGFQQRGHHIPGFDACFVSSVPSGGGLSSSAALECAVATLLEGLLETSISNKEKALLAQEAEHNFAGVPCGIMDQFASAFGKENHLILIDCESGEPELVPFDNPDLAILIANTCVSHDLSDGGYAARRKDTEEGLAAIGKSSWRDTTIADIEATRERMGDRMYRRSRHVVTEIARTIRAAECFKTGEYGSLAKLMKNSHNSLRDDFNVSCPELDLMVSVAEEIGTQGGVFGSRMTGGGFGGSTVTLCQRENAESIATVLSERFLAETQITPEIFVTRPARGAHLVACNLQLRPTK